MRAAASVLLMAALGLLAYFGRRAYSAENGDPSEILLVFGLFAAGAVMAGALFAITLLPFAAEWIGNFFYSPIAPAETDPHALARARVAAGDFEGAALAYAKMIEIDSADAMAVVELARIESGELHRTDAAIELLERALQRDWPRSDAATMGLLLADLYVKHKGDAVDAAAVLRQIASLPHSSQTVLAERRLRELEAGSLLDEVKRIP